MEEERLSIKAKQENLEVLEKDKEANIRYQEWIFSEIRPFLKKRIMEVGSGIGNYTRLIAKEDVDIVIATELFDEYLDILKKRIDDKKVIFTRVDLENKEDILKIRKYEVDTIVSVNVLEHIENDEQTLRWINEVLPENGRLIFLVPAYQSLYSEYDKSIGHHRRYSKKELCNKVRKAGFDIKKVWHFNFIGALAWFIKLKLLKSKKVQGGNLRLFNKFIPIFKIIDKYLFFKRAGISLIIVADKKMR